MPKPLPCPFCGATAIECGVVDGENGGQILVNALCEHCGACGPCEYTTLPEMETVAYRLWNHRCAEDWDHASQPS